jgi:starch synthase (maltosyl-transferring)
MTTTLPIRRHGADPATPAEPGPGEVGTRRSIIIEHISPVLDCGRYPVKRVVGDDLLVTADIFVDGHDLLAAVLLLRAEDEPVWTEEPMRLVDNDRWSGAVTLTRNARHRYVIEAWRDAIGSWRAATAKKLAAGVPIDTELAEGRLLLQAALLRARARDARTIREALQREGRARSPRTRAAALAAVAQRRSLGGDPLRARAASDGRSGACQVFGLVRDVPALPGT